MRKIKFLIIFFILIPVFLSAFSNLALAKNTLYLNPESINKPPYEMFPLEVKIDTSETVVGVDLDISYDPEMIEIVKIIPGTFFENPKILANNIDKKTGLAMFSLYSETGKSGSDTLVSLTVKALPKSLSPAKIKIADSTLIAGLNGKKISVETNEATITISLNNTSSNSPSISPVPTNAAAEPTIILVDKPSSPEQNVNKKGDILKIIAFVLLLFGVLAIFVLKKFPNHV